MTRRGGGAPPEHTTGTDERRRKGSSSSSSSGRGVGRQTVRETPTHTHRQTQVHPHTHKQQRKKKKKRSKDEEKTKQKAADSVLTLGGPRERRARPQSRAGGCVSRVARRWQGVDARRAQPSQNWRSHRDEHTNRGGQERGGTATRRLSSKMGSNRPAQREERHKRRRGRRLIHKRMRRPAPQRGGSVTLHQGEVLRAPQLDYVSLSLVSEGFWRGLAVTTLGPNTGLGRVPGTHSDTHAIETEGKEAERSLAAVCRPRWKQKSAALRG